MIKFGMSGWRGIIADDFTCANVAVATQAIANLLKKQGTKISVIIGYDTSDSCLKILQKPQQKSWLEMV
jgi:phosphomannomutase